MSMSDVEKKLFREAVIKEYKQKLSQNHKQISITDQIYEKLKRLIPFNIAIGFLASVIYIYLAGWVAFLQLLLMGVIWVTVITGIISMFIKVN